MAVIGTDRGGDAAAGRGAAGRDDPSRAGCLRHLGALAAAVRCAPKGKTRFVRLIFPGSPVDLRYTFTLAGGKIDRLEIVP
jgi:hypothetical protein